MKILFFFSKTDPFFMQRCNYGTKMHQMRLGIFVLLTGLFAFISGFIALTMVFGYWDEVTGTYILNMKQQIMIGFCSFLYAALIVFIDSEIVSARNKAAALLRIPLAVFIGIIISIPIKIEVLEDTINKQIQKEQNRSILAQQQKKEKIIFMADSIIGNLELQGDYYTQLKNEAEDKAAAEDMGIPGLNLSGVEGRGRNYGYAVAETRRYEELIAETKNEITTKKREKQERLDQLDNDFDQVNVQESHDLWSKYKTMGEIVENDKTGRSRGLVLGLSFFFILLELIPSLIKLIAPENEYDQMLEFVNKQQKKKFKQALQDDSINNDNEEMILIPEIRAI